ncbi:MAG: tetratricopeptide repeat protein [Ferruginibacter sp.]
MKSTLKKGMMMIAVLLFAGSAFAQSIEDGKKFMYYERFESAKGVFEKLLAANPKNEQAAYYLGQADIGLENIAAAKTVYQNFLSANPNSPLVLAGMGHVELAEGKTQDARSRFETAISLSKGKSIEVLNAVGFANGNPDSKNGDAAYAIEKLKQATEIKGFKDPEVWANLGDAYRKFADGGNAVQSYAKALAIDPQYARAMYRTGRVYQTQGVSQEPLYMDWYNKTIAADPKYAPVYATLYSYYYESNVGKSAEYLDKWLANSDDDPKACYYRASMKYAQGLFTEAISKADECAAAEGANPYPNLFGLKAYSYNRLSDQSFKAKDSVKGQEYLLKAKDNFDEYLKRQNPDKIGAGDYSGYASILVKFPGNEEKAVDLVLKAVDMDSVEDNKIAYLKNIGSALNSQKKFGLAAKLYAKIVEIKTPKKTYSNLDLYNAGYPFYQNNQYDSTIKYFTLYTEKYPKDIFGYYMLGNASAVIDSNSTAGLAAPYYLKVVEIGEADLNASNVKPRLITAYRYFMGYEYNVKKNKAEALKYADKAVALAPEDASLKSNRDFIANNDPNAPASTRPRTNR